MDLDDRESDFKIAKQTDTVIFQPNHSLMARPGKREIDNKPQRIFFYKRIDIDDPERNIFAFTEQEAAMQMKGSHAPFLRLIGVSDGSAYRQSILSCGYKAGDEVSLEVAQKILKDAFNAELESARGNFDTPEDNSVHFMGNYPLRLRQQFVPPAEA